MLWHNRCSGGRVCCLFPVGGKVWLAWLEATVFFSSWFIAARSGELWCVPGENKEQRVRKERRACWGGVLVKCWELEFC